LSELCGEDIGIDEFSSDVVIPYLNKNYPQWRTNFVSIGDPAGAAKNQTDEKCCFDILRKNGMPTKPASSNLFTPRREAVAYFLRKNVGGQPAFAIDSNAHLMRAGFNGEYYYSQIKVSNDERYREVPEKNKYSHPADAFQYISLYYKNIHDSPEAERSTFKPKRIY
jgi:hypothetical protein